MARGKDTAEEKSGKKKYSRRDFVVGSGTVLAGGALAVFPPEASAIAAEQTHPLSTGYLVYDSRR